MEEVVPCYDTEITGCRVADVSGWGWNLALTKGVDAGRRRFSTSLSTDDVYFPDDAEDPSHGAATKEYGHSQRKVLSADWPVQWEDAPVFITDNSFTVSVWVHVGAVDRTMAVVSARGDRQSVFSLGARPSIVDGVAGTRFEMTTRNHDRAAGVSENRVIAPAVLAPQSEGVWTHLVAVYDETAGQVRLYVDGEPAGEAEQAPLWRASGPLLVGSAWSTLDDGVAQIVDQWVGGIDELYLFQGAMTATEVMRLHRSQAEPACC